MKRTAFAACLLIGVLFYCGPHLVAKQVQPGPVVNTPGTVPAAKPGADVPSQPAVAVTEVKSPAAPAHYTDQALWALMVSFLIQFLKKSPWFQWITPASSRRLKTQFGFLAAFMTAAGIHFAVSGSVLDDGGLSLSVSGLTLNAMKDVLWQWAAQQGWYRAIVKEPTIGTLINGTLEETKQ